MNAQTQRALDTAGIVGTNFRADIARDVQSRVVLREALDPVRLTGPTGTGKELVANFAHVLAAETLGRTGPLVKVSAASLPDSIDPLVAKAAGGTFVIDEFEDLPRDAQGRLLRLLGEREYRVGKSTRRSDALFILVSNRDLKEMSRAGELRRDLLDRASAKIELQPLYERRADIRELTQHFSREAAAAVGLSAAVAGDVAEGEAFEGLTRRAHGDIENALIGSHECSVRRLRELVRDVIFDLHAHGGLVAGAPLTSEQLLPYLQREFGYTAHDREAHDVAEVEQRFQVQVEKELLARLAQTHHLSEDGLKQLCGVIKEVVDTPDGRPFCYRNVVERSNTLMKVAFWLVTGARTQAEFRRFFGDKSFQMPAKSVAWQIFNEVFPDGE